MSKLIHVYLTDYNHNQLLKEQEPLSFGPDKEGYKANEANIFNVYDQVCYQEIVGFGGAMTQASAANLQKMDEAQRNAVMRSFFDPKEGIGYSLCRTTINSCDFSTEFYSYDDTENDWGLKDFNIEHDRSDVIPMIRQAMELSDELRLFSSPWSPPKWMKTNGRMDKGRYLRKDCRQVWADYFVRFLQEYEKEGIRIWGVTIQNEARAEQGWESCYYTAQEEREFAQEYLKPALRKAGLDDRKLLFWDHNKERVFDRTMETLATQEAQEALDGVAVHWYAGDHFSALDAVHQMYPDKLILATEACVGPGCCAYTSGEKYAHDIIGNVNHWAGGWVDWNMILDDTGRPDHWMDEQLAFKKRFEESGCDESALSETEREFLLPCVNSGIWRGEAPVVMDHETKELHYSSSYYYMGHFSKFVRPGAVRIANSIYTDKLEVCTFANPDGSIAAIAMNPNEEDYPLVLRYHDEIARTVVPAHGIVTYVF